MDIARMSALGLHSSGIKLLHNGQELRGIGVNHFSLILDRKMENGCDAYDWRASLRTAKSAGAPVVRTTAGFYNPQHWETFYRLDKAAYYGVIDEVIAYCESIGIGLIMNLAWGCRDFAGWSWHRYGVQEGPSALGNPMSNTYALQAEFVAEFVQRYQSSPAIWAWEFCNEPIYQSGGEFHPAWNLDGTTHAWLNWGAKPGGGNYLTTDKITPGGYERWAAQTRNLFKSNDSSGRLILSGDHNGAAFYINAKRANSLTSDSLADWQTSDATEFAPAIIYLNRHYDAITSHTYPRSTVDGRHFAGNDMTAAQFIGQIKTWSDAANKPMVLEEFGATYWGDPVDESSTNLATETSNFAAQISAIQANNIPLSLAWNMEGALGGAYAWQKWKLNTPARFYQIDAIAAANAAMQI